MNLVAMSLLVSTSLYAGFQWTIRVAVYPQFRSVGRDDFVAYERRHQLLTSIAVIPLFAAEGVSVVVALITSSDAPAVLAASAYVLILIVTGSRARPAHRQLSAGFDEAVHRKLLAADSIRLLLAVVGVAAAIWFAL